MAHLHKLEKWRNPETKARAVIAPIFGTDGSVSVLFFEYRQRYANGEKQFRYLSDAREHLKSNGYSLGA